MVFDHHKKPDVKFRHLRVECPEPVEGQFWFYLIECADNSIYVGSSINLPQRIEAHNVGKAAQWTKIRTPVQLVYYESYESLLAARQREKQVKGWVRQKKENFINGKWGKLT